VLLHGGQEAGLAVDEHVVLGPMAPLDVAGLIGQWARRPQVDRNAAL
jgi:hypothetical protein